MTRVHAIIAAILLSACGRQPSASVQATPVAAPDVHATSGAQQPAPHEVPTTEASVEPEVLELPWAEQTMEVVEATEIVVAGDSVFVDGRAVDTVPAEIVRERRLRRLERLFDTLKAQRALWKQQNSQKPFPGVAQFAFDENENLAVVKSVFQTAAFAGYPNGSFLVNQVGRSSRGRLNADAQVPVPSGFRKPPSGPVLYVELVSVDECRLGWKQGETVSHTRDVETGVTGTASSGVDAVRFPKLAAAVVSEWRVRGSHRAVTDRKFDQATVRVPSELEFKYLVAAIDAVYSPQRSYRFQTGTTEPVPAFNVTFSVTAAELLP